ncbi:hypothetical protein G4B88_030551 [Cannabis sativa]|uniref:Pentatricopeptide repeat-containing protein n=1 Tax=Cannabis sativa TaxID=3483 RepID=A0A7J6EIH7_CANSA|nr:hypothetical protein G4B88_030551 [Cannabis sativa]
MLSPTFSSPNISFNLTPPPSQPPFLSIQPFKLQKTRKNSINSNNQKQSRPTWNFRCFCYKNSSFYHDSKISDDFSRFYDDPKAELCDTTTSQSSSSFCHSLCPSSVGVWLRSCQSLEDVKRLHGIVLKCFGYPETYVYNNLICVYLNFERLSDARNVFDKMTVRNVVTWTAVIDGYMRFGLNEEAFGLFKDSIRDGVRANEKMFVCLMNLCSKRKDFELGRQIHGGVIKGSVSNMIVDNSIVKFYAECGDLKSAFRKFEKMAKWDVFCWTTMITACSQHGNGEEAISLFSRMLDEGFSPNGFTVCGVLKACGEKKELSLGRQLHGAIVKEMYKNDVFIGTSLVDMYAKCGEIVDSRIVFDRMNHRNIVTWTSIIAGYARKGRGEEAIELFRAMKRRNIFPNNLTIVNILRACGSIENSLLGREVHAQIVKNSIETNLYLGNTLVWFYCRFGEYSKAIKVLQKLPHRDVFSWTAIISGCTHLGYDSEALEFLREMIKEGVEPNSFTYSSALKACAQLETVLQGRLIHYSAKKTPSMSNVFVGSALIYMYSKCGYVTEAFNVFENMPEKNFVAWKSMIMGYARNGFCNEALKLMYRMRAEGFEVDDYVRTTVLAACGDVELDDNVEEHSYACSLKSGSSV